MQLQFLNMSEELVNAACYQKMSFFELAEKFSETPNKLEKTLENRHFSMPYNPEFGPK